MHKSESIVLGGGCFWCLDAAYRMVNGVTDVMSGFAGGGDEIPSYYQVASGATSYAEVIQLTFDPEVISIDQILDIFFTIHDPTTLNRQGADVGPQYRSAIFYSDRTQADASNLAIERAIKVWDDPIVTEVRPLDVFHPAEDYHQDYYRKNQNAGYCQVVINPKLAKLRTKFEDNLK